MEYLKSLSAADKNQYDDYFMSQQVKLAIDKFRSKTIGVKEDYVPKSDLHFDEYLAIKNDFAPYSFQKNFKGPATLVYT